VLSGLPPFFTTFKIESIVPRGTKPQARNMFRITITANGPILCLEFRELKLSREN